MNTDQLRNDLHDLAGRAHCPPDDLAATVLHRRKQLRRERGGVIGAALTIAVVVGGVHFATHSPDPAPASQVASPGAPVSADVLGGPTRGNLAGDTAFTEAVRALPWSDPGFETDPAHPDPATAQRRVVFAGDVAGGRWALVVGASTDAADGSSTSAEQAAGTVPAVWFIGPAGASPEQLVRYRQSPGLDPAQPTALFNSHTGALVVIAAPGDEVGVSRRPDIAANGTISRTYETVAAADGGAVLTLDPGELLYDEAVSYRVLRDGAEVVTATPVGQPDPAALEDPDLAMRYMRAAADTEAGQQAVQTIATRVVERTGLRSDQLDLTVHWTGTIDDPAGTPATAALMTATLPSGAVLVEGLAIQTMDGTGAAATQCAGEIQPAGPPATDRSYAAACSLPGKDGDTASTLITANPTAVTTVRVTTTTGTTTTPTTNGISTNPVQGEVISVEGLDASGTVISEAKLSPTDDGLGR